MDSSRLPSVAPTPSPSVLAPGIRLEGQGKAPPRVPSPCRTIRRVLVASPDGSSGWQTRPGSGLSVDMQGPDMARAALRFGGQGESFVMAIRGGCVALAPACGQRVWERVVEAWKHVPHCCS